MFSKVSQTSINVVLREPKVTTFLWITEDNHVHLMVPFIGGSSIATDNTCQTMTALNNFLGRNPRSVSAKTELLKYKEALDYDLQQPLPTTVEQAKRERLTQINELIRNLDIFLTEPTTQRIPSGLSIDSFPPEFKQLMQQKKNLFWVLNRPSFQDGYLNGSNYVFSMRREGTSLFYNSILRLGRQLRPDIMQGGLEDVFKRRCLSVLSEDATLETIQRVMKEQMDQLFAEVCPDSPPLSAALAFDFTTSSYGKITEDYISMLVADYSKLSLEEKIIALIQSCASERLVQIDPSPFHELFATGALDLEKFSIMLQLFMGMTNIYAYAHDMTTKNFAQVLEDTSLANAFEVDVLAKMRAGIAIEKAIIEWMNEQRHKFFSPATLQLSETQLEEIKAMFLSRYQVIKDAPHFDEFMVLYNTPDRDQTHFSHSGFICTPLEFLAPFYRTLNQSFFSSYPRRLTDDMGKLNIEASVDYSIDDLVDKIRSYQSDAMSHDKLRTLLLSKLSDGRYVFELPHLRTLMDQRMITLLSGHANQEILVKLNNVIKDYQYIHITPEFLDKLYLALIARVPPTECPDPNDARQIIQRLIAMDERSTVQKSALGGHIAYLPRSSFCQLEALAQVHETHFYLSPKDASKIYRAVERHFPEHAEAMNQLVNTGGRGPEKFRFALNLLGIPLDQQGCGLIIPPKPHGKPDSREGYVFTGLPLATKRNLFQLMSTFDEFEVQQILPLDMPNIMDGSLRKTILTCPAHILQQFRDIVRDSRILGTQFYNPYLKTMETFPSDPELLTARHLQIIARNQAIDDEGVIFTTLYDNLLSKEQIA